MKKEIVITICTLMIIVHRNLCMKKKGIDKNYEQVKAMLEKAIVANGTNCYSSINPAHQYDMLKSAISKNKLDYLNLCLRCQFNPNRYRKQLSLLHYAIQCHNHEAIKTLARYNPDLIPLNDTGQTPLDYAMGLKCEDCINAMCYAISKKYNELMTYRMHCGLTKHILNPGPCEQCPISLRQQLRFHGLWEDATKDDLPCIITEIKQNSVYSYAESGS